MQDFKSYADALSSLHVAKVKGYKAPHKAVLLLAVIDLIEEERISSNHITLTDELDRKFNEVWMHYLGNSAVFTPDITKPFFHMQHEPFWRLVTHEESERTCLMVAEEDTRNQQKDLPKGSYSVKSMREAFAYAEIEESLFLLLHNADARAMLRVILINTYLTNQPTKSMANIGIIMKMIVPIVALVA